MKQRGRHLGIINEDCDKAMDDLLKAGIKYDLILTDPPYNVGKDFGNNSDSLPLDVFLEGMQLPLLHPSVYVPDGASLPSAEHLAL